MRGCPRHGCRGQAPKDGFTASPPSDTTPPNSRKTRADAFAVAVAVASAGAGLQARIAGDTDALRELRLVDEAAPERAGADGVLTYFALDAARWLREA